MENKMPSKGDSKYAKRFALRRRACGGAVNPMPMPLFWEYIPSHNPSRGGCIDYNALPHERQNLIRKFQVRHEY